MAASSALGMAARTRIGWSVLALFAILFHTGLAATHCHELEAFQTQPGFGRDHVQNADPHPGAGEDETCVICQLLSIYKGTAPASLIVPGTAFVGLAALALAGHVPFVPHFLRLCNRPRDPPAVRAF